MDIKITDKALRYFLKTQATPEELASKISLCGPTFDRINKVDNDYVYDIEVITNRIDTASAQGIARDSVAVLNQLGIKSSLLNDPYQEKINLFPDLPKTFTFEIAAKNLVPRFTAVSLENIQIKDSPQDTQTLLALCGERPLNNAIDITNELTLLYGMPSHIFDLDKLAAQKLLIRESKKDEVVTTLDNQKNTLNGGDLIIEDGSGRLVDLCGIMGGAVAEVDQHTKNILLIVPVYNPGKIRKTSLYLQKRTLAAQIYEKQPDTQLCLPVLMRAIKLFAERTGAKVSSTVYDSNPDKPTSQEIVLEKKWANKLIGVDITTETITSILKNLGFEVQIQANDQLACTVPSWRRHDINIKEDLVEEIARVYGYSQLPSVLPCVNLRPEPKNLLLKTESKVKNFLACQGFNEVYNSSLVPLELINKTNLQESDHLKLNNALSVDYEYLRTSLVPSLLQNLKNNQGKISEPLYLFEVSNIYQKTSDKLPQEISKVASITTTNLRQAKGYLESLFDRLNLQPYKFQVSTQTPAFFQEGNTAEIISGGKIIGFFGYIKPSILHSLGLLSDPLVVDLDTNTLTEAIQKSYVYKPISEFPEMVEQITIKSKGDQKIGEIIEKISSVSNLINQIIYTNSYQNNHSFKITFSSFEKNLTQQEVNEIKEEIQKQF